VAQRLRQPEVVARPYIYAVGIVMLPLKKARLEKGKRLFLLAYHEVRRPSLADRAFGSSSPNLVLTPNKYSLHRQESAAYSKDNTIGMVHVLLDGIQ
jgi:hypothetical protein